MKAEGNVIAFEREHEGSKIVCVFNTSKEDDSWTYEGGNISPIDGINNNISADGNNIKLQPYGYGIFKA